MSTTPNNLEKEYNDLLNSNLSSLETIARLQGEIQRLRGIEEIERDSRGMFVARLENMQKHKDYVLTVADVLALLSDCDYLAQLGYDITPMLTIEVNKNGVDDAPYGYCLVCGAKGVTRERRINGKDTCANGCSYLSRI